ncbi:uncharacterized protein LOC118111243 [Hippoglossus stenolepis]|uniref:uncharacterized protein LOC118111243 n=1 Tax=Hippoglossus stenolepis TaxID=195615 RepID=UPI001FAE8E6C|nr:uncharacterized protein LOC118111243 [Hippoglossus stenolepis]XP_035015564.2 uncharacterized protein LOC118111243 [Hippoglossus stenolepis]XP_035015566.2 uncharacterized protein LOC118111243 [Hippoglossus stenolepis]
MFQSPEKSPDEEGSVSPEPSHVSVKSDSSMGKLINFSDRQQRFSDEEGSVSSEHSHVSVKSDSSMGKLINFSDKQQRFSDEEGSVSSEPSHVSVKSDSSMGKLINFSDKQQRFSDEEGSVSSEPSHVSVKSDSSMGKLINFSDKQQRFSDEEGSVSSEPSHVSVKSDSSMGKLINFSDKQQRFSDEEGSVSSEPSHVSVKSDSSMGKLINFSDKQQRFSDEEGSVSSEPSHVSVKSDSSMGKLINFSDKQQRFSDEEGSVSSEPSHVSVKSDSSMGKLINFSDKQQRFSDEEGSVSSEHSHVSVKSDSSMGKLINFSDKQQRFSDEEGSVSSEPSHVSVKSDSSMGKLINFSDKQQRFSDKEGSVSSEPSHVSVKSDSSMDKLINFSDKQQSTLQPETMKEIGNRSQDDPLDFISVAEKDAKQELRDHLKKRILDDYKDQNQKKIDTELFVIKAVKSKKDKPQLLKSYNEIFEPSNSTRTVLMKGVPGIGKTFQKEMLMVDWAKGNSNKDIDLIVSFNFNELNSSRDKTLSMEYLLNNFFSDIKPRQAPTYDKYKVAFILDGLEECKLDLDFEKNKDLTDIKERASMDVLLKNLIKGTLLPSARLWIISQPSGVDKIPSQYIQKVTECREKDAKQELRDHLKKRILDNYKDQSQKDTELFVIKAVEGKKDKPQLLKSYNEIFEPSNSTRTVLMKGVPGIGKTFQKEMLMVDWAKGNSNKDIDLIVSFNFNQLNSSRDKTLSMEDLLNNFFSDIKPRQAPTYDKYKVAFILDGLEECKLDLDFEKNKDLTDIKERASMDVLLKNLIKGTLLPSARLWIISQPSGVDKIPSQYIQKVTECRETLKRRQQLVSSLKKRFCGEYSQVEDKTHPNQKNTEHIIREKCVGDANDEEKNGKQKAFKIVNETSEIFKCEKGQTVRTLLTIGEPDIGKTFHVKKFIQNWAENNDKKSFFSRILTRFVKAKDDEELIFPLDFFKLNGIKEEKISLVGLLNHLFEETKESVISNYDNVKVLFVLDGLDCYQQPLDFNHSDILTDVLQPASVDVLLTNLIKGNLLPSAQLWITSRSCSLPDESYDRMTEIREKDGMPELRDHLKKRILNDYKDQSQKEIDTELFVINAVEGKKDEPQLLKSYNEIFEPSNSTRTVLMKGVPGIGKTFQKEMLMVDWAKGNSNKDTDLIVSFNFNQLNSSRYKTLSMEDLLNNFFRDIKPRQAPKYDKCKVAFILDGLEKCKLDLDFEKNKDLTDIKERASMDVLLKNLIKGTLLPSARLWIISQPSGVDKIPSQYIQKVTECRETLKRRQQLVSSLKKRFCGEYSQVEDQTHPNQKNTEHIIREKCVGDTNDEEKNGKQKSFKKVNETSEIFKCEKGQTIRTLLTIGEPDVGKTFHVKKFIQNWAENNDKKSLSTWLWTRFVKAKDDEELIFPLDFLKLNGIKEEKISLVGLLNHLFKETKEYVISNYENVKVLFVLDGLDCYQQPLDFNHSDILTDVLQPASVDVLLTNLINGNLLPSAQLWITSRSCSLPDTSYDRMTEIREKPDVTSQRKLKSQLREQFTRVSEGIDKEKTSALLNDVFTNVFIIEGQRGDVNDQHEVRQVQEAKFKPVTEEKPIRYHDIFKPGCENIPIRTVLTIGVAGIGKSFASMKYMLDWAEGKANTDIQYIFPLPFRELNLQKDREHSFEDLLHQFCPAMKESEISNYDKYKVLIVLDGFDECRLDLNFSQDMDLTDVKKKTSVNVLLANLIKGNLLSEAQIWITSRPAASSNIPADKVDRVTEVRGFNDDQKEEYFGKRFSDKDFLMKVLSHVKKSRSLYIMCHLPVFCWITSKVLEDFVNRNQEEGMPKTLTDMYLCFLLLQCRQANVKYGDEETSESSETDSCWNTRNKDTILSLGKLAFEELEKGNLLFTEENLTECGIDIEKTAVFSGLFTRVTREGCGQYQNHFFCFVHLSIQEFLAAFFVLQAFNNKGENLLSKPTSVDADLSEVVADLSASDFYKRAVDKALDSKNGDWDLFLRFLLGLSLETNQNLLKDLLKKTEHNTETNKKTIDYIKHKISEEIQDSDKNLNLFHCLNELNDQSLVKEVKKYLLSETKAFENFSTSQWSALTYVLLMSDEKLDVFDLKKYLKSEKVFLGMLPVVKVSKTTLLSWCKLSEESCKGLTSSVLTSTSSNLIELDLSHNDLLDSGVELLANGLKSLQCKLESLKLSGCKVTEKGCFALASALDSNLASPLKELDLSYNHPGDSGSKRLTAIAEDPKRKLQTLCLDHGGAHRLKPGLKKYAVDLKFDEKTASRRLVFSESNRKVRTVKTVEEKVSRLANDHRFKRSQVSCEEGLKGLWYWEVEWSGEVCISVAYGEVSRKWDSSGGLGCNKMSWSLRCSKAGYTALHGKESTPIKGSPCQKIAVFLDWDGGSVSYYSVTSETSSLIHTFSAKFTQPLFPSFWFRKGSLTLCEID